ncbi:hypothetical protein HVY96_22875 (plasmid) [Escherichia fergusonii]|uniref:hypothetical protein n=1 Tax=Escherichia TaxID=561 RepID=UPI0015E94D81|nr:MULTISPECIES: hypothetical protein [Escherichia]QME65663.1 hypothetical protein HVZ09_23215 [Escherichia fergusonii]QME70275.1 hypothetical protein HVZ08_23215 [Escherichia fergusonii]QMF01871.1 hypothetical protein HVY96_22875 [Escherichia fergusonii]QMI30798.1 hypothetical protein HVY10_23635 [Escherichia coli]
MFLTATPVPVRMSQKAKTSTEYTFIFITSYWFLHSDLIISDFWIIFVFFRTSVRFFMTENKVSDVKLNQETSSSGQIQASSVSSP